MLDELFVSRPLTPAHVFTEGIEGPACDAAGNLYAVNYARQGTIGIVTPLGDHAVFLDLPEGSVGNGIRFGPAGEMYIADYVGHRIYRATATRELTIYAYDPSLNQPNDLAIDSHGQLYASDPNWTDGTGQIWRVGKDRRFVRLEAGMGTTNGIEVAPDGRTLYVNETVERRIWAYDLAPDGAISARRLLFAFSDAMLDGMRCDVAGNLYVARYGRGSVAVVSAGGALLREIALHGRNVTNLTFGGADGRTCYVTVADTGQVETFRTDLPGRCWALWR